MISRSEAEAVASAYLQQASSSTGLELVILDNETLERDFGWVFFYDSKAHIESRSPRDVLAGNAPIIVDRNDGSVHVTGTAEPIERYIENYRSSGSPHRR